MRNQKGFTLVEVLVASGLLILGGAMIFSVIGDVVQQGTRTTQRSQLQRVVRSLLAEINSEYQFIPAVKMTKEMQDNPNYAFDRSRKYAEFRCYDRQGGKLYVKNDPTKVLEDHSDPNCFFKVAFYRVQVVDNKFGVDHLLGPINLTRTFVRVEYREGVNKNGTPIDKTFYVSQLLTPVLSQ